MNHSSSIFDITAQSTIRAANGIRGLAVLMVLLSHASNSGINIHPALDFGGAGRYGVGLFFVLSSFLLTKQFLDASNEQRSQKIFWINYFFRRFLRIYPLYAFCYFVYLATPELGYLVRPVNIRNLVGYFTLIDGKGFLWTLPVEFQYYFLLPIITSTCIFLLKRIDMSRIIILLLIFTVMLHLIFPPKYTLSVAPFLSYFLFGSITALFQKLLQSVKFFNNYSSRIHIFVNVMGWSGMITGLMVIPFFFHIFLNQPLNVIKDITGKYIHLQFLLFSVLWSMFIFGTINNQGVLSKFFSSKIMSFVGMISFSAYLLHMPIIIRIEKIFPEPSFLRWCCFMLTTLLISWMTYKLIEQPFSRITLLKRKKIILNTSVQPSHL